VELGLRYIARRLRFEREVRTHLQGKGVGGKELEEAVARLRELGVLSDFETCRAWIRDRLRFSPRSRAALRRELARKGAEESAVEEALDELCPAEREVDVAVSALQRTARTAGALPEAVVRRRMWAALGRRGFDPGTTREAIARVLGATEETE
jgi:regulatory protein